MKSFFKSFKDNFKQSTFAWLILLFAGAILYFDLFWSLSTGGTMGNSMLLVFGVTLILYVMVLTYVFPLIARCKSGLKNIFIWAFVMSIRNIHLSILMLLLASFAPAWPTKADSHKTCIHFDFSNTNQQKAKDENQKAENNTAGSDLCLT